VFRRCRAFTHRVGHDRAVSKSESNDNNTLQLVLSTACSVRIVAGGQYEERDHERFPPLIVERDEIAVRELVALLQVRATDFDKRYSFMTPGDLTLAFYDSGHDLLTTVTFLHPDLLRWNDWPGDAGLIESGKLTDWLTQRGWAPTK
jgi:hypothetical protein